MWQLYYSKSRDGISYKTLMRKSSHKGSVILLIKDTQGAIFGGFYSTELKWSQNYTGTGESF